MIRVVALAGVPASGKTTLMRRALELLGGPPGGVFPSAPFPSGLLRFHVLPDSRLLILGDYSSPGTFAGTDRLSMAVAPQVTEFLARREWDGWTAAFEGDRLTGGKLLDQVARIAELWLIVVDVSAEIWQQRQAERGNRQSAAFLAGRRSKVDRLRPRAHEILANSTPEEGELAARRVAALLAGEA